MLIRRETHSEVVELAKDRLKEIEVTLPEGVLPLK